jgi:transposase
MRGEEQETLPNLPHAGGAGPRGSSAPVAPRPGDPVLATLGPRFQAMHAKTDRPSIPPEQLLKALLLQILYSIRSERQLVEHFDFNLLYRWFVGLSADAPVWHHSTFTKNRERLEAVDLEAHFFHEIKRLADRHGFLSHDHFTVDGTLLEAAASLKSFRPRDDDTAPPSGKNPTVNFHGERRSNETHVSRTDPDARLARKGGTASRLAHQASVVTRTAPG